MYLFSLFILCGCGVMFIMTVAATCLAFFWVMNSRSKRSSPSPIKNVRAPKFLGRYIDGTIHNVIGESQGVDAPHLVEVKLPYGEVIHVVIPFSAALASDLRVGRKIDFLYNWETPTVKVVRKVGEGNSEETDLSEAGEFLVQEYHPVYDVKFKD